MAFGNDTIKVLCKRCGKQAYVSEMTLDPVYRMVVCPTCVKERRTRESVQKGLAEQKLKTKEQPFSNKPAGWDAEDEYLERLARQKQMEKGNISIQKLGPGKIKYTCAKCKHAFVYYTERKYPNICPYCGGEIIDPDKYNF